MKKNFCILLTLLFFYSTLLCQNVKNSDISKTRLSTTPGNTIIPQGILNDLKYSIDDESDKTLNEKLTVTPLENSNTLSDVNISVNSSVEIINIQIPEKYKFLDIKIYDSDDNLLINRRNPPTLKTIDINKLGRGTYFLHLINPDNNELKMFKLIKN